MTRLAFTNHSISRRQHRLPRLALTAIVLVLILGALPLTVAASSGSYGQVLISVAPVKPKNQDDANSLLVDIFGSPTSAANSTIVRTIIDHAVDNQNTIRDSFAATARRYEHAFAASGKEKNFFRMVKAENAASAANLKSLGMNAAGKLYGGYCLYTDVDEYFKQSKHRHSFLALFDKSLQGFNVIASGLDLVGVKTAKPLAIGGGILKDTVGGDAFSSYCNSSDNFVLYGLDTTTDYVNESTYEAMLSLMLWYYGVKDADTYGRPPHGTGVYKPNIYLYPETDLAVDVAFRLPDLLTVTDPDYDREQHWQVKASPDGWLTDPDTGAAYGYLFYESETDPALFDYSAGWTIAGDPEIRREQFTDILTAYGFTAREIDDFTGFWTDKLDAGVTYVAYPQLTAAIDCAMPIRVAPQPDSIYRLWFAFKAAGNGGSDAPAMPEPVIEPIARNGFTLVEWGGFILE